MRNEEYRLPAPTAAGETDGFVSQTKRHTLNPAPAEPEDQRACTDETRILPVPYATRQIRQGSEVWTVLSGISDANEESDELYRQLRALLHGGAR